MVLVSGCYKQHLYAQMEWIDANFLASSRIQTPDPRQAHPPQGQRLIIAWDFPKSLFEEGLQLFITVRLWDNTQEVFHHAMERKREAIALYFPNDRPDADRRVLTYLIQVVSRAGDVVERWEHQLWTKLIDLDAPKEGTVTK